jgi:hypothetical protein
MVDLTDPQQQLLMEVTIPPAANSSAGDKKSMSTLACIHGSGTVAFWFALPHVPRRGSRISKDLHAHSGRRTIQFLPAVRPLLVFFCPLSARPRMDRRINSATLVLEANCGSL